MIDIIQIKKEFKKYISNYNYNEPRIALKVNHIERVANNCREIANGLNLSQEEVNLAEAIGIFHDLGRFEQVRNFNTFDDRVSKINHAEYSVKILFEENFIRKFIQDTNYDNIIKTAILNHNKIKIDENVEGKELLFSKIIRDADKLDILSGVLVSDEFKPAFWYDDFNVKEINKLALENFFSKTLIKYENVKNNADQSLVFFAYVYDMYFDITLKILKQRNTLKKYADKIKNEFTSAKIYEQVNIILEFLEKYFEERNI